jgi:hypothetical protein
MTGEGYAKDDEGNVNISVEGGFFLNSKSIAYGWYSVYDEGDSLMEQGLFFGKVNLKSSTPSFSFKLTGYDANDDSMSKAVLKGKAN